LLEIAELGINKWPNVSMFFFTMIASVLVTNVVTNKYIILSQETCEVHDNKYNCNKISLQIIPEFKLL